MTDAAAPDREKKAKNLATLTYALYAASFLVGLTSIVAIIINYVKRPEVAGTVAESHFTWQIRTFWFGLLWGVIGALTTVILVGFAVLLADAIWVIYRLVKGFLALNEDKPIGTA